MMLLQKPFDRLKVREARVIPDLREVELTLILGNSEGWSGFETKVSLRGSEYLALTANPPPVESAIDHYKGLLHTWLDLRGYSEKVRNGDCLDPCCPCQDGDPCHYDDESKGSPSEQYLAELWAEIERLKDKIKKLEG